MEIKFKDILDLRTYLFLGKAFITVVSLKTKRHFTFSIIEAKKRDSFLVYFNSYNNRLSYLATLRRSPSVTVIERYTRYGQRSTPYVALRHVLGVALHSTHIPPDLEVYHPGKCGRCGRTITVPQSIERGIGPECYKILGFQGAA